MSQPRKFKLKAIKSSDSYNSISKWIVTFSSSAAIPPEEIEVIEKLDKQKEN